MCHDLVLAGKTIQDGAEHTCPLTWLTAINLAEQADSTLQLLQPARALLGMVGHSWNHAESATAQQHLIAHVSRR